MPKDTDPCQKQACAIQKCLQENNYNEDACQYVVEAMRHCCKKFYDNSKCCSGFQKPDKAVPKETVCQISQ
ncbi:cx9C motif-containing protein 4-like [Limulus polyphemus]|uniref:Cx9C motif-containing protein 4-like n=1 Tax=Limulus polyphemus TaxID=6850 RepID=A0ABM1S468_LIMPO|nr:cx9C motif-containing protein 4-like [Limulus polyphemus]